MALVMIHLLIAQEWAQRHPEYLESPEYYLGAISPDAIHVRDGNDKSRKDAVHYNNWRTSKPEAIADYRRTHRTPFDVGYAVHCLTDGIWVDGYKSTFPGIVLPDGRANPTLYYNDVYGTEKQLYAECPFIGHLLELIASAELPADHPMLTAEEFGKWRANVLQEYDIAHPNIGGWRAKAAREAGLPEPMNGDPIFITPEYIRGFLKTTCDKIDEIMRRYAPMNEVLQTISDRRSIRAYEPTPVAEADLQAILTAGLESPTARNLQLWHFSVITNRDTIHALDEAIAPGKHPCYEAPVVIVISVPKDHGFFAPIDCGIAVQNMALAAWSLGYGNVILGMPRVAFTGENGAQLMQQCGMPEDHEFMIAIAIGKAAATKDAHEKHPEKISYVR